MRLDCIGNNNDNGGTVIVGTKLEMLIGNSTNNLHSNREAVNVGTNLIVRSSAVIDSLSSISILAHLRNFCLIFFIAHAFGFLPSG